MTGFLGVLAPLRETHTFALTMLYRAEYGKEILAALSQELTQSYGNKFGEKNLRRMIQFSEVSPDERIVVSLIRQIADSRQDAKT